MSFRKEERREHQQGRDTVNHHENQLFRVPAFFLGEAETSLVA